MKPSGYFKVSSLLKLQLENFSCAKARTSLSNYLSLANAKAPGQTRDWSTTMASVDITFHGRSPSFVNRSPEQDANKGIGISGPASLFATSDPSSSSDEASLSESPTFNKLLPSK